MKKILAFVATVVLVLLSVGTAQATGPDPTCQTFDRGTLTWDWNREVTVPWTGGTLVKPAGGHNAIKVTGTPVKITIVSNGGTQDRTGQTVLNGDYGSDIQSVTLCAKPIDPILTETYSWRLPNGGTQSNVTWPQPLVGVGVLTPSECAVTYQVDTYRGTRTQIDSVVSDGVLLNSGEDSSIYVSHEWTYGGDCPVVVPDPQYRERTEIGEWSADTLNCTESVWTRTRDAFTISERSEDAGVTWIETGRTNTPATETVRQATAQECGIRPVVPTLPEPEYTTWVDGTWGCDDTTVVQTRTRIDYTQPEFDEFSWTWPNTTPSEPVTETQTRDLTESEMTVCPTPTPEPATGPDQTISAPSSRPPGIGSVASSVSPHPTLNGSSDNSSKPSELAHTGTRALPWALGALALIGGGAWLVWRKRNA